MKPWTKLEPKHFPLLYTYIKSAVARGHYDYNLTLVQSMAYYGRQLFYTIEDDVLLVARNARFMNTFFHKLLFQPIHLGGDRNKEIEALKNLVEEGGSARIPLTLAKEAGLAHVPEPAMAGGKEVLYLRQDFNLAGKKYANIRNMYNRFKDNISKGKFTLKCDVPLQALSPLYEKWLKERGYVEGILPLLLAHPDAFGEYIKNLSVVNESGDVIFTSLYLEYGGSVRGVIASMTDFSCPQADSLQVISIAHYFEQHPELAAIFWGGWDCKGVEFMKKSLPHTIVHQVRPKPAKKLTKEEWLSFTPNPTNFFEV